MPALRADILEVLERVLTVRKLAKESELNEKQYEKIISLTDGYLVELVRYD